MSQEDIPLVSRDGQNIPNAIDPEPSESAVRLARSGIDPIVLARATELAPPSGRYNCHGLVFASRRTNIRPVPGAFALDDLLKRDGYQRVRDAPQVGDVAVYRDALHEIEHTGFVCAVDVLGSVPVVQVWSKWGTLGEYRHHAHPSPYTGVPEYWRLTRERPRP